MTRCSSFSLLTVFVAGTLFAIGQTRPANAADFAIDVRQITSGPQNHFFGYIGHVQNIPWNGNGRYLLALRTTFQDRMPGPDDPAEVVLLDAERDYSVKVVERTRAWNPQQGTMFYWNPAAPDTQFFFNDRDPRTGKVFCVLFDISRGKAGERVREYRFDDTAVGNGGVSQVGGEFLAINYGRMARLRPVTGYKDAFDWTVGTAHPRDDGIFKIDMVTGSKTLLVSFEQLARVLRERNPDQEIPPLFINHTLWNREGDRIFFFARAGWDGAKGPRINQPFVMHADGSHLTPLAQHIGGHPEWDFGRRLIGRAGDRQILFDADKQLVIGALGSPDVFPDPEGDITLSPDGRWFANGYKRSAEKKNYVVVYRRADGAHLRSPGFEIGRWGSGDLRLDPSPCWNRANNQLLVPGLSGEEGSRQMFLLTIRPDGRAE